MILADWELEMMGENLITPFIAENVQPASIDVRLGNDFKVFERDSTPFIDLADPADITKDVHIEDGDFFLLHPGEFVLGVTKEFLTVPNYLVARIEGRSSVGRLGLMVHVTAGYIDPGFNGPITLEIACMHPLPIKLRPGHRVAQFSFHRVPTVKKPYTGRYQNAKTVQSSRFGDGVPRLRADMQNLEPILDSDGMSADPRRQIRREMPVEEWRCRRASGQFCHCKHSDAVECGHQMEGK